MNEPKSRRAVYRGNLILASPQPLDLLESPVRQAIPE
jgi:hypothetical protein